MFKNRKFMTLRILLVMLSCIFFADVFAQGKITHPQKSTTTTQQVQSSSSIPTTIAGYSLGKTTRSGAENYTFNKGYSLSYPDGAKLTAHHVNFSGYEWDDVKLFFYNNKLYKIVFSKPCISSEKDLFYTDRTPTSSIFSNISQMLSNKYSRYNKGNGTFNDGKTTIIINSQQLIYLNNALNSKATNTYDDL